MSTTGRGGVGWGGWVWGGRGGENHKNTVRGSGAAKNRCKPALKARKKRISLSKPWEGEGEQKKKEFLRPMEKKKLTQKVFRESVVYSLPINWGRRCRVEQGLERAQDTTREAKASPKS